jgi:C1A family cysteine protease
MAHKQQVRKHKIQGYGWRPDLPDARDHLFTAPLDTLAALPASVDLRPQCPPVYDQGELGSCTANATAGALQFERERQNLSPDFVPSRLFIYYNERVIERTTSYDSGAQLRDGIKVVSRLGACPEADWPYVIANFAEQPPENAYADAVLDLAVSYSRVHQTATQMKACLAGGFPFIFGFSVYESFESDTVARTGVVPMPGRREALLGGHAVMAVGYADDQQRFICRNSWGSGWGLQGYFTIPYAYLTDPSLASDFWTIRLVSAD